MALFEITTYKLLGNRRIRMNFMELTARDPMTALEKYGVHLRPDWAVEIRLIPEYPKVSRIEKNGVV